MVINKQYMKKDSNSKDIFTEQLKKGLTLSFKKLVKKKQQTKDVLAFSKNGKIVKIKATDIKL